MSTETPIGRITFGQTNDSRSWSIDGGTLVFANAIEAKKAETLFNRLEHENARLREELAEAKRELAKFGPIDGNRDNTSLENWFPISAENLEQAEARALEYKTEHAALLGTSQWQEVEIADLRDDVKRHMQIASEWRETVVVLADACCHPTPPNLEQWGRITIKAKQLKDAAIGAKHASDT